MEARIPLLIVAGLLNGAVTGTTGANGMVLILSFLVMLGLGIHETIGICLVVQLFTMSTALAAVRTRTAVSWRLALVLCVPASVASLVGAKVALRIPGAVLEALVIGLLLCVGLLLLRARKSPSDAEAGDAVETPRRGALVRVGAVGVISGGMAGMVGGGGNIVVANALNRVLGLPFRRAVALSLCLGITSAALGSMPYLLERRVDPTVAIWVLVPALIAAWVTSRWSHRVSIPIIRRIQGVYLTVVATMLAVRALV